MRRRRYLVCYDIANPKRLRKTAKICESFGTRIQYSVFEASLDTLMLARLKVAVDEVIHHQDDQVIFIDLGPDNESTPFRIEALGFPYLQRTRITII